MAIHGEKEGGDKERKRADSASYKEDNELEVTEETPGELQCSTCTIPLYVI
jgi:hypothetical protein